MTNNEVLRNKISKALKSNVLKVLAFLLVLIFLLRSASYIMRVNGPTKDRFAGFYAEDKNTIDVMMFGSSTVASSFIPAYMWHEYGFTSYPLSSNSIRPKAIKYLIEESMKYQNPKLIIVEIRTFIASDEEQAEDEGHTREVVDNMNYSIHRIKTINALTEKFDDKYPFYFDIMKYHSNYGLLLQPSEWKKYDFKVKNILKGFELKKAQMAYRAKEENRQPGEYNYNPIPIPNEQEEVLKDLLSFSKENNLNVLFVVSPRDCDTNYEGNMCYMKEIINDYGYELIDTNELFEELQFDYRFDMDDGAHTNVWGALKVSDYVGKYISDNYLGSISHSDKVKKDWNEAYVYFNDLYESTEPEIK